MAVLGLARSLFDEHGGQGAEDERLDAAREPIEVEAGDGRQTDRQPGELGEHAAEAGEETENAENGEDDAEDKQLLIALLLTEENHGRADQGEDHCGNGAGTQSTEERIAGSGQGTVDQGTDNGTGQNVAEVTASHADRGEELSHDIDGCHDKMGSRKPFR